MKKQMRCADETGFPIREFEMDSANDGTCTHCGYMQRSFKAGLLELVDSATWQSDAAKAEYQALADAQGDEQ